MISKAGGDEWSMSAMAIFRQLTCRANGMLNELARSSRGPMSSRLLVLIFTWHLLLRTSVLSLVAAGIFWYCYSYPVQIAHGVTTREQALGVVFWSTAVVICIVSVAWQVAGASRRRPVFWKSAIFSGLLTACMLAAYAYCAIVYNGYSWRILGEANLDLFRETDRLIFILEVIPAVSIVAGILVLFPTQRL